MDKSLDNRGVEHTTQIAKAPSYYMQYIKDAKYIRADRTADMMRKHG